MGFLFEIAELGPSGLPEANLGALSERAEAAAPQLLAAGFNSALERPPELPARTPMDRVVVLGIGGSALGARTVHESCRTERVRSIEVVDNIDPEALESAWGADDPARAAWVVVSKSGATTEILAQWKIVRQRLGALDATDHIHVVTGTVGPLREQAERDGFPIYEIPEEVGGRYSVFTPAATVPLALAGHDVGALLEGARAARDHCAAPGGVAARLAALLVAAALAGRNVVALWSYAERLETLGEWFRQLWAESLGKIAPDGTRVGQTPLHCVGSTDQHSIQQLLVEGPPDKVVLVVAGPEPRIGLGAILRAMRRATTAEMVRAGCPVATFRLDDWSEASAGALLETMLCATVLAGGLLEVDPYGQPGVEAAKVATKELLGHPGGELDSEVARLLGEGAGRHCP
jgi:glucose-6-phosphate isomerase